MKRLIRYLIPAALLLALLSCKRSVEERTGLLTVTVGTEVPEIIVKGLETPPEEMVFSLTIAGEDGVHNYSVADARALATEPLIVAAGRYTVTATSGSDPAAAAWGAPIYTGSTTLIVKPEQLNTARITCTLSNTMVTVEFEDPIPDLFSDYRVTVDNGAGEALVFSKGLGTIGNTAYFAVTGTLNYELNMVNNEGKSYHNGPLTIEDVKANQHYHFKFSLTDDSSTSGGFTVTIIVDDSTIFSEYKLKLDFGSDGLPVTTPDFPHTNEMTILEGNSDTRTITFVASRGIGSLIIHHGNAGLTTAGLPTWTDLVTAADLTDIRAAGVVCSPVDFGTTEPVTIDITSLVANLPVGRYTFSTTLIDTRNAYNSLNYNLNIIPPVESRAIEAEPWARFAILSGVWYTAERPAGLKVQYRKSSDSVWLDAADYVTYDEATKTVKAEVWSLTPGTGYVFRVVTQADLDGGKDLPEIGFVTAGAPTVPNLSFDGWYKSGSAWIPNTSSSEYIWDSANPGTASLGVVPTTPEESDVVSGKAARLESTTAMGQFAAGNIYIGKFDKVSGVGAELDWGYGFTGRPIALRGYYKYAPATITKTQAATSHLNGTIDNCSIQVYLTNWSNQFHINTSKKIFLADDDPSIIAKAALYSDVTDSAYKSFVLPITYLRTNEIPTYIVISAAASRYGDYFTGGIGSVLKIDEFELVYNPAELTEAERQQVGYRK